MSTFKRLAVTLVAVAGLAGLAAAPASASAPSGVTTQGTSVVGPFINRETCEYFSQYYVDGSTGYYCLAQWKGWYLVLFG